MKREMIVAYGKYDRAIGQGGQLPWGNTLKYDMRRFRQYTLGKSVIMGRNTYESIGHPLAGRENIVVTSRRDLPDSVVTVHDIDQAYARANYQPIVIGGGMLYAEALPHTDDIYVTEVDGHFPEADTFFPEIPPEPTFIEAPGIRRRIAPDVLGGYAYEFTLFTRHLYDEIAYESFV